MMNDNGYAVYFFPQALEALGEAIKPYLQDGPSGLCVRCQEIDTAGSLIEMTLEGRNPEGQRLETELMVPTAMVRMIVSAHSDEMFGFGPYAFDRPMHALPAVGPTAEPATATSEALPRSEAIGQPTAEAVADAPAAAAVAIDASTVPPAAATVGKGKPVA